MTHAEKCPVCGGKGNARKGNSEPNEGPLDCHGCNGKGWVEVEDHISPPSETLFVTNDDDVDEHVVCPEFDSTS